MLLDGREVVDVEIDGIDRRDYPDFCDSYFAQGYFADTGEPLTTEQLDRLGEKYSDLLHAMTHRAIRYGAGT